MTPTALRRRLIIVVVTFTALVSLALLVWYRSPSLHTIRHPNTPTPDAPKASVKTYTLRGRIEQLPDPAVKGSMLQIHHERIEGWVNRNGETKGMNSMVMPFPPADGVSLAGLAIGDLVEFKVEFDFSRLLPQRTVAITKLAPDTVLTIQRGE